jgi:regulator of RNase E activity RraA
MAATWLPAQVAEAEQGGVRKPIINPYPYTAEQDDAILKLFADARVSDVADALDTIGLPDTTIMTPDIQALWRDTKEFTHRIQGVAITARYVKSSRVVPRVPQADYDQWAGAWYKVITPDAWVKFIRPGMIAVLDKAEDGDTRNIGSNNSMGWKLRGLRGIVTNGGAGDTDEIIAEKIPLYMKRLQRGYPPGRSEIESVNLPVMVGNVLVRPGDVIVADGDGVVVVPRQHAEPVAARARKILEGDKAGRRKLYEKLGLPPDKSVLP